MSRRLRQWQYVALGLTFASPAAAFRSGGDLPSLSGTTRVQWPQDSISFVLEQDVPANLDLTAVGQALQTATSTWSAPVCSAVTFSYKGTTGAHATRGDGINTIEWVSDWATRGFPADAAGATDVQYAKVGDIWTIVEADMYLNASFAWSVGDSSSEREVTSVVTHEAGHMLGLLHPCEPDGADGAPPCGTDGGIDPYRGTTMYPFYSPSQSMLSQDDVDGVCFLYPRGSCPSSGCENGQKCTAEGCRAECSAQLCQLGAVCANGGCYAPTLCAEASCAGKTCVIDGECGVDERCASGVCTRGLSPNGDPCSDAATCAEGACLNGFCAQICQSDSDCAMGDRCDPSARACDGALAGLGRACANAADCLGGECLSGAAQGPICTRQCGVGQAGCPIGWACTAADGKSVCAPPPASPKEGCTLHRGRSPSGSAAWIFFVIGFMTALRRGKLRS